MMRKLMTYGFLALASALIGLMIGGGPGAFRDGTPEGADFIPVEPTTTTTSPASVTPASTESPTTEPLTTELVIAEPATTEPASSSTTTTSSTSSTSTTSTVAPSTTTASTTTVAIGPELIERGDLTVAVANGTRIGGIAGDAADVLIELGYAAVGAIDADDTIITRVYYTENLELEARRLAEEVGLSDDDIAVLADAPSLFSDDEFQLVLLLGRDQRGRVGA